MIFDDPTFEKLGIYYSGHGYSGTKGFSKGDLVIRDKQAFTFDDIYYCIQPVLSVIEIDIRLDSCYSGEWVNDANNNQHLWKDAYNISIKASAQDDGPAEWK